MIPKFLQPERVLFASLDLVRARIADVAPVLTVEATIETAQRAHMVYRLHVRHPNGSVQRLDFATVVGRDAALVGLKRQPVDLKSEDVAVIS